MLIIYIYSFFAVFRSKSVPVSVNQNMCLTQFRENIESADEVCAGCMCLYHHKSKSPHIFDPFLEDIWCSKMSCSPLRSPLVRSRAATQRRSLAAARDLAPPLRRLLILSISSLPLTRLCAGLSSLAEMQGDDENSSQPSRVSSSSTSKQGGEERGGFVLLL